MKRDDGRGYSPRQFEGRVGKVWLEIGDGVGTVIIDNPLLNLLTGGSREVAVR